MGKKLGNIVAKAVNLATILFVTLRACDVIDWKWYWVLSPLIAGYALVLLVLCICGAAAVGGKDEKE